MAVTHPHPIGWTGRTLPFLMTPIPRFRTVGSVFSSPTCLCGHFLCPLSLWPAPWVQGEPRTESGQLLPSLPSVSPSLSLYFSSPDSQRATSQTTEALASPFQAPTTVPPDNHGWTLRAAVERHGSSLTAKHMWPWALSGPLEACFPICEMGFTRRFLMNLPALEGQASRPKAEAGTSTSQLDNPTRGMRGQV